MSTGVFGRPPALASRLPTRRSPPRRRTKPRHGPRTWQKAALTAAEAGTQLDTAKAASEAKLALEPVSVYISRATQKLYVRRNTHKRWPDGGEVFDATIEVPVTIRNPDKPRLQATKEAFYRSLPIGR
jgi:hypothetical protein